MVFSSTMEMNVHTAPAKNHTRYDSNIMLPMTTC